MNIVLSNPKWMLLSVDQFELEGCTASRACLDQGNTSAEKIVQGSIELHGD